ncbi:MAG: DNA ligase [Glaciimonas sp.]|nr:DNA ligase [Glaciimonas sp.]
MKKLSLAILIASCFLTPLPQALAKNVRPPLMLANTYHPGINLSDYWVSEKYDGVRGYWDGQALWTRGGEPIQAPPWFTANWPNIAMDGELWAGRDQFEQAVSTVRQQTPNDAAWRKMHFMAFDLPAHRGTFDERLPILKNLIAQLGKPWVVYVTQTKVSDQKNLNAMLTQVVNLGGEGLALHRGASLYRGLRSDDLLKVKQHTDAEAKVINIIAGKGKYQDVMGALLVETSDGRRFRIGSGFKDADRRTPPAIGSWISYRYRGVTSSGIPRFATFIRIRDDVAQR